MMLRKDSLIYKMTQLHWFMLLTIVAIATFGTLILFSAASSAHNLQTGLPDIHADLAFNHALRFGVMLIVALLLALCPLKLWASLAYPVYAVGVVMLVGVEAAGVTVNGAERARCRADPPAAVGADEDRRAAGACALLPPD